MPSQAELITEIERLKAAKNAVILAHNYERPEIQDIADYLGLTIETVSRTLTQLRKESTISLKDNRHIEAVGLDMLEDLAEGL